MSQPGALSFSGFVFWLQSLSCPVCPWTLDLRGPWDLQPFVFSLPGSWTHAWQPGALDVNVSLGIWTGGEASSQGKHIRACKLNTGPFFIATGGLASVIYTDTFQAIIMLVGSFILMVFGKLRLNPQIPRFLFPSV